MIEEGANLEAVDKNGWTALHVAAESDKKEAAEINPDPIPGVTVKKS